MSLVIMARLTMSFSRLAMTLLDVFMFHRMDVTVRTGVLETLQQIQ
jgi:aryl-alcohol dehydrogenase-like predicted oxidoreductase